MQAIEPDRVVGVVSRFQEAIGPEAVVGAVRSTVAGSAATQLIAPAAALFEAGGKLLLDDNARRFVISAAERTAEKALALAAGPLLAPAKFLAERPVGMLAAAGKLARRAAPVAARTAGTEILKGAGKAAGIGLLIEGGVASVEAFSAVRSGAATKKEAATYVMKEAATGAVATGAGVLLGAGFVAVTGGAAAPVVFAIAALGSVGAKNLLNRVTKKRIRPRVARIAT